METVTCDICSSKNFSLIFESKDYITGTLQKIVRCRNCGFVYVNPQPSVTELKDFYPQTYYGKNPFFYEKIDVSFRFKQVRKLLKKESKVLDIGCGRGLVLSRLKKIGCEVWGTELSEISSKYAREILGLNIINKNLEDCAFKKNSFDVVTMFHSLEHLIHPLKSVKEIYRILKPGGILIIEVPRFDSFHSRIFKDKWFHLDVPRHLFHFNDQTLEKLVTTAGFSVITKKRYSIMYDSFGALQSILNSLCSKQNLLNDLNTKRITISEIMKSRQKRLIMDSTISLVLQTLLFIPLVILTIILSPLNIGGTLTLYAKKNVELTGVV